MTQTQIQRRFSKIAAATNQKCRRLGISEMISADDLATIFLRSMHLCAYCGIGIDPLHCSFDHEIPFDAGGRNVRDNLVACCMTCQRSKGKKLPEEFAATKALGEQRCEVCGVPYQPRWSDWKRGYGRTCSLVCAGSLGGRKRNPASLTPGRVGVTG